MQNISIHLDLSQHRDRILFAYIQAFDLVMDNINQWEAQYSLDMSTELDTLLRDYNYQQLGGK